MSGELSRFLHLLSTAVDAQDGATVAKLLSFQNAPSVRAVSESLRVNPKLNLVSLCEQRLREPMDEVMVSHCQYLFAFAQERYADAYAALVAATTAFLKEFRSADTPWPNPVLQGLTYELRVVAMKADEQLKAAGKKAEKLGDAGSQLMKCFSTALQATNHKGKRMVTLHIVVQLFKIYFKLNTLRLCKNLIKAVDAPTYVPFGQFPQSQKVSYKFYLGQLSVFEDNFQKAAEDLGYAFQHCHVTAAKNKRMVLRYLVPVKLLLGQLPTLALLQEHQLMEYAPLMSALKEGNVRTFEACLERNQRRFIKTGVYLLLEKLKFSVYRNLLKRCFLFQQARDPAKAHQLSLLLFQRALQWLGSSMDMDEVECIVANLIYRRYVKGYISHKSSVVVLSKQQPFPPLTSVALSDP